jgi:hypothetical protein
MENNNNSGQSRREDSEGRYGAASGNQSPNEEQSVGNTNAGNESDSGSNWLDKSDADEEGYNDEIGDSGNDNSGGAGSSGSAATNSNTSETSDDE